MAKKVDEAEGTNTFDPKRVEKLVRKIEGEHEGLVSEKSSYMSKCKPYRERIAMAYEEGIGFGLPKKLLQAKIKERAFQRKIDGIVDDFEDEDERDTFEQITQALGGLADLPLGQAAVDAAAKKGPGRPRKAPSPAVDASPADDADDEDIRSNAQKLAERDREEEDARIAAENSKKLGAGISQLPH